jgi:CheY-like chemotaxis protein
VKTEIIVLVAEDEDNDFFLLDRALRTSIPGIRVHRVRDGGDAIDYLKGEGQFADRQQFPVPHVVMLDLKMPGTTGMEVLQWIRDNPRYRVIPTLVMTSSHQPRDVQQAYHLGANTYFVKPGRFDALVDLCRQIGGYWKYGEKPRLG